MQAKEGVKWVRLQAICSGQLAATFGHAALQKLTQLWICVTIYADLDNR
jgi:hypothetical protein